MASKGSITQSSIIVPAPTTVRGQSTKLYATPDGSCIAYGAGRTAVIRPIAGEGETRLFGHAQNVTVVKPLSNFFAASGDAAGNVKVWDTTGNYSVKLESKPLAKINDIAVDGEGKRIIAVGEGRSGFGASFSLDTGSSIGEISGHSKVVNAVAMKANRPFRAVTGSDDFGVCVLNGVPFKYASMSRRHTRFVQSVAYSPDGSLFASAGSDGQVLLYDGSTGEEKGALVDGAAGAAHSKGVFAVSFSKDGKSIATSSADASVKLWEVESRKVVQTWNFEGDEVQSQQVGNTFAGDLLVSLSFSGNLTVLDPKSPTPLRTLYGHQNPVTALAVSAPNFDTFVSGDSSGRMLATRAETGEVAPVQGGGHAGLVVDVVQTQEGGFVSAAYDDTVKALSKDEFSSASLPAGAQPKALASAAPSSSTLLLATSSAVQALSASSSSLSSLSTFKLPSSSSSAAPLSLAVSPLGSLAAVATDDSRVHLYLLADASSPQHTKTIELRANATALAFPPDEATKVLAVGLATGKVPLYSTESGEIVQARWTDISARVTALAFSSSGKHLAASSLDESVRVYSVEKPSSILSLKNLHRGGVNKVVWAGEDKLVSAGADGAIRMLDVKFA
ncbi:WD40 repeat domain-containing protein [Rhodotorula paludigena]|uniref:WD40 repeat domain-containing protein n=1 Tax=Rhodotorula paludigena TaxID=86838 RepID=UPI003178E014